MFNIQIPIAESKKIIAKIILIFLSLISKFFCQVLGASFQTELLIMNFLGAVNSVWDWQKFNWTSQVDDILKIPSSRDNGISENIDENYEFIVKKALTWVVVTRIMMAHVYTFTYITNFYSIITWSQGNLLFPWLVISAVKNFVLEAIVLMVVGLLYVENQLSGYLVCGFIIQKIVTLAPAVYNWLTMHALYKELEIIHQRKLTRRTQFEFHQHISDSPYIILGMQMRTPKLHEKLGVHIDRKQIAASTLKRQRRSSSIPNFIFPSDCARSESFSDMSIKFTDRFSRSLTTMSRVSRQNSQLQNFFYQLNHHVMEDSILTPVERARRIFNVCEKPLDNIQLYSHEFNHQLPQIEAKESEDFGNKEEEISVCICSSQEEKLEVFVDSGSVPDAEYREDDGQIDEVDVPEQDFENFEILRENESTWPENWILKQDTSLEDPGKNAQFLLEDEEDIPKWSSDYEGEDFPEFPLQDLEESCERINNPSLLDTNELIDSSKTWRDRLQIIGGSFESTLQQIESKKERNPVKKEGKIDICRSWVLDGMSIKLVRRSEIPDINDKMQLHKSSRYESKSRNGKCVRVSTERKVQTEAMEFADFRKSLETKEVEMKALRAYNAKTLWRDKIKIENQPLNSLKSARLKHKKKSVIKYNDQQKKNPEINNIKKLLSSKKRSVPTETVFSDGGTASQHVTKYGNEISKDKKNLQIFPVPEKPVNLLPSLREKIQSLDWSIDIRDLNAVENFSALNYYSYSIGEGFDTTIEDIETIDSLQGAFSFDPNSRRIGFISNPNSSGLFSVSEQIPNVLHEIIKTARLRILRHDCNHPQTSEVDYGDKYLEEMTKLNGDNIMQSISTLMTDGNVAVDNIGNDNEDFSAQEREVSSIQSWVDRLRGLVTTNIIDLENSQDVEMIMNLPGFNQIQNLIDYIRRKFMSSVSTMTSRVSIVMGLESAATSSTQEMKNVDFPLKFFKSAGSSIESSSLGSLNPEISLLSFGNLSNMSEFPET